MPPKIKIFLWHVFRGQLPSVDQIRKHNGPGSDRCSLCYELEDANHIFLTVLWLSWLDVAFGLGFMFPGPPTLLRALWAVLRLTGPS